MARGERLDVLMVARGLSASRTAAQGAILAGDVYVDGVRAERAGALVAADCTVEVRSAQRYVSRGGLKLERALAVFPIDLAGRVCADIGASTGGFTDCMLQHGAALCYAVDVGHGQLAYRLRIDERVRVMERTNARFLQPQQFDPLPTFISIDVSFISIELILPALYDILPVGGEIVALIKPQFEAGRAQVGKHGVVRDEAVHMQVCTQRMAAAYAMGFHVMGLNVSPIRGPKGNVEFLMHLKKEPPIAQDWQAIAENIVLYAKTSLHIQ